MTIVQLAQSGPELVSLQEAKAHLRVEDGASDVVIDGMVSAAREWVERVTRRVLVETTFRLDLCGWPRAGVITLPVPPLKTLTSVQYIDDAGVLQTLASDQYQSVNPTGPAAPRATLQPAYGVSWPSVRSQPNAVQITFTAGYAADAFPRVLKVAILLLLTHLFEHRGDASQEMPSAVKVLLAPYVSREVVA